MKLVGGDSFVLPGTGWELFNKNGNQIGYSLASDADHKEFITCWPVQIPESIRNWSEQQHVAGVFQMERTQPRPPDVTWTFGKVGELVAGSVRYPSMPIRLESSSHGRSFVQEGLFVLVFEDDWQHRGFFYCIMWTVAHPADETDHVEPSARNLAHALTHWRSAAAKKS